MSRGTPRTLPSEWTDIAIPAFKNDTTTYRIEQRITEAVIREFITRTKYRVVQDPTIRRRRPARRSPLD